MQAATSRYEKEGLLTQYNRLSSSLSIIVPNTRRCYASRARIARNYMHSHRYRYSLGKYMRLGDALIARA